MLPVSRFRPMPLDQPKYLPAVPWRSIGSSYLIRQVAGSERLGGLTVTIRVVAEQTGDLRVDVTDWKTGEPHECADEMAVFVNAALDGVLACPRKLVRLL